MRGRRPAASPSPRVPRLGTAGQGNFPVYGFQGVELAAAEPLSGGLDGVTAKLLNPPDKKTTPLAVPYSGPAGEGHAPGGDR
jgi:hypothetical protein